jgi:hypothetical protein
MKLLILLAVVFLTTGCTSLYKAQLEGKLPKVNAEELSVEGSSIWGVSGTLKERGVKWDGNQKSVAESELRITSPAGSYHRVIKGASTVP